MTARGVFIHVGRSDMAHQVALLENLQHILWILDHVGRKIFHVHTRVFIPQLKPCSCVLLVHQVTDFFLVNFKVGHADQVLAFLVALNLAKNVFKRSGHHSFMHWIFWNTRNRPGFASTRLAVGKNSTVVTFNDVGADRVHGLIEQVFLRRVPVVD